MSHGRESAAAVPEVAGAAEDPAAIADPASPPTTRTTALTRRLSLRLIPLTCMTHLSSSEIMICLCER
jgi:hypothetical protein